MIIKIFFKKTAEIFIKVPDIEWQTSGQNVRPPASNENPAVDGPKYC